MACSSCWCTLFDRKSQAFGSTSPIVQCLLHVCSSSLRLEVRPASPHVRRTKKSPRATLLRRHGATQHSRNGFAGTTGLYKSSSRLQLELALNCSPRARNLLHCRAVLRRGLLRHCWQVLLQPVEPRRAALRDARQGWRCSCACLRVLCAFTGVAPR